ncbi:hypothetical protein HPP92_019941 [Vanilla planifolia]|uniref:Uncharacterized protein n=1 Tax=Vanilla planifolia TaxID=51239 RepID=A0A835QDG5_VANPL|nr:hypothetical protein HPP92_019941 [Vanilla planifolia]
MDALRRNNSPFDCLLFDLDDTLYPSSIGISQECKKNIDDFLRMKCSLSQEEASSLRVELFKTHGSSLAGLMALGYDVHPDAYHSLVHGLLPYERIGPDPKLRELLLSITQPKILFTNSDRKHASRVLQRLGIEEECFHRIICFETMNPELFELRPNSTPLQTPPAVILKPFPAAFNAAISIAGFHPHRMLFLDDSESNISAAKSAGLCTAVVGRRTRTKEADYALETISGLRRAIPEIWCDEGGELTGLVVRNELDAIRSTTALVEA